ncbi:4Fe-4S dicluster domain-containing protein [Eubacterium aggregans]|uniref:4Fe-4S dicluster domain-containing protein n=1 Tax=Eubacterium aggregans TaxID=81409 RepID=UPI003F350B40
MAKQLLIKPEECLSCRTCETLCSFGHFQVFNPKLSNVTVFTYEAAAISVPVMCLHCSDASCVAVCPVGAMTKGEDGLVTLNQDKCIGCKMCLNACPLWTIGINPATGRLHKCDLCDGDPQCAKYCPTGAIEYADATGDKNRKKAVADGLRDAYGEEAIS